MTQRDSVNGRENTAGMFLFFSSLFFHRLIFSREGNLNGSVRVVEIIVEFTIYVYIQVLSFELFLEFHPLSIENFCNFSPLSRCYPKKKNRTKQSTYITFLERLIARHDRN